MQTPPLHLVHLLPVLDEKLLTLLRELSPDEWNRQTVASKWKVKDVVAHLLDGNIRILSMLRDGQTLSTPELGSFDKLTSWLNHLNAEWVDAMKRVSPQMLIALHEFTGPMYCRYYASLDPFGISPFSVAWAGEAESRNWMHIAREYTEKWIHQQQIREAVQKQELLTREYFHPFFSTLIYALPYTLRHTSVPDGSMVRVTITGSEGGSWQAVKGVNAWALSENAVEPATAELILSSGIAWKLFSRSLRPEDVRNEVQTTGDPKLAEAALHMVSVMA